MRVSGRSTWERSEPGGNLSNDFTVVRAFVFVVVPYLILPLIGFGLTKSDSADLRHEAEEYQIGKEIAAIGQRDRELANVLSTTQRTLQEYLRDTNRKATIDNWKLNLGFLAAGTILSVIIQHFIH